VVPWANPDLLRGLAAAGEQSADRCDAGVALAAALGGGSGGVLAVLDVANGLRTAGASLRRKADILDDPTAVPVEVPWDGSTATVSPPGGLPPPGEEEGRRRAETLLDALGTGSLGAIRRVVASVAQLDRAASLGFLSQLGADGIGLLPTVLLDNGVAPEDLGWYIAPVATALASASALGVIDARDLALDHQATAAAPTMYLDFGAFDTAFVAEMARVFLAPFEHEVLALVGVPYLVPGGATATADTRLAIVEEVLTFDIDNRARFVDTLVNAGAIGALTDPATPWIDGGTAVEELLASIGFGVVPPLLPVI